MLNLFYLFYQHLKHKSSFFISQRNNCVLNDIKHLTLPDKFIIPLKQHSGLKNEICVCPGEKVLRGQLLIKGTNKISPIHAPTSGFIESIGHNSAFSDICIVIIPDGEDCWIKCQKLSKYQNKNRNELLQIIHDAGILQIKQIYLARANSLNNNPYQANTLIIKAIDSETYITSEESLTKEHAAEVLEGCRILGWIFKVNKLIICIEKNKIQVITALSKALGDKKDIYLHLIPHKYSNDKQLIKIITGFSLSHERNFSDLGIIIHNASTAREVKRAIINGEPVTEGVTTLTGDALSSSCNVWARIGTPIYHILYNNKLVSKRNNQLIILARSLNVTSVTFLNAPVVKSTNFIFFFSKINIHPNKFPETSCIRCGICAEVCPIGLLPQQLYWYSMAGDHNKTLAYHINKCIECDICSNVCPSNISLVNYFRQEKAKLQEIKCREQIIACSKKRFHERQKRLIDELSITSNCQIKTIIPRTGTLKTENNVKKIQNHLENDKIAKNKYKIAVAEAISRAKEKKLAILQKNKCLME
ncbi:electron transport complex subunit RsxC [Candidatus Ishikawella capsulata]|uniref:Ion-translocating oxidoreductase complex subunit C n=1 Tax=Candidatus Ishikawaella capsulata Mpkobe TaxID=476281 RepID=C5WD78_9ENTR|nr:electron transport complex subunit RsxC [Candidatus Ishikawaella capsulata]BAH83284.1 member of SoxR-reducing complex [Candidatus Ishikawaella capsulata Mpkobe]